MRPSTERLNTLVTIQRCYVRYNNVNHGYDIYSSCQPSNVAKSPPVYTLPFIHASSSSSPSYFNASHTTATVINIQTAISRHSEA